MISKNTWLLIRFFSFKDSSRFLLKAISVKEYMIVWWTRKWDVLVGRGSLKTTNSVHAAVTVLCMSASRVAPGNGWEGLVSEKPLFPDQRIITQTLGIHGEGDQTEGERSFKQKTILQITVNGGWNVKKRNHDLQDRNFCKVSLSLYLRTFGAFCHMEGKKYRASSGGCREAAWAECQSQALAMPRSRLESRRTASEAAYLKSLAS